MIKFSDISRTVLRVGGGGVDTAARTPTPRPEEEERTEREVLPFRGQGGCVLPPFREPSPLGLRGSFGAKAGRTVSPTPERASFPLCTRAGLPLLLTLFIQTEAAGWFSHLCVCRYIDFVLKEDRLNPPWVASLSCPRLSQLVPVLARAWEAVFSFPRVTVQ